MEKSVISKAELRRRMLERRKQIGEAEKRIWDQRLLERIEELVPGTKGTVYCYMSVRGEAGTGELVNQYLKKGVRVALPRVERRGTGERMRFYYIRALEDLVPGAFGIPEPSKACEGAGCPDAPVLVPGVAFSRQLSRLGYGGGFYDRFFAEEPQHEKIGLCYGFQLVEALEWEEHDVRMDRVVTPEEIISV